MNRYLPLIGRILLGLIFVMSGFSKIANFSGTAQFMASQGVPLTNLALVLAIVVELFGGLSLFTGYRTKFSAPVMVLYLIPVTFIFHADFADQNQMVHFLKNLAIMGGLVTVWAHGSGSLSLEKN